VNACPTSALQPSLTIAGLEGLYTPVLVARRGWCEPSCTRCGQVCPTAAIASLTVETKGWSQGGADAAGARVKIGTAFFDWGRCLPWAMATPCVVCEEVCPTSPKAIRLEPAEAVRADGRVVGVGRPRLDPDLCTGCGLCEAKCPVASPAAVRITRAGESRDARGGFTLSSRGTPVGPVPRDLPSGSDSAKSGILGKEDRGSLVARSDGGSSE
jgi:formate hydrogenlyase subunit 6/NADH:ubiquinone oxidoreductase subunit I